MAEQIKFGDRLFLRGEKTIFDNGLNDAIIEARNGTLEIRGNLVVTGTTTTVNSEQTSFADPYILLNGDHVGPATEDVGIEINRGDDPNVFITWDESTDQWTLHDKDLKTTGNLYANIYFGTVTGDIVSENGVTIIDVTGDGLVDIRAGNIDGTVIGASASAAGTFTTITGDGTNITNVLTNYTTDNLAEGLTNLYYTDERVDDRFAVLFNAGYALVSNYDDALDTYLIDFDAYNAGTGAEVLDTSDTSQAKFRTIREGQVGTGGNGDLVVTVSGDEIVVDTAVKINNLQFNTFTGNGSTSVYTLPYSVTQDWHVLVYIDGVVQEPTTSYTISGTTLTLSAPLALNSVMNVIKMASNTVATGITDADTLGGQLPSYYLDYTNHTNTPTTVSSFTNDAGYLTSSDTASNSDQLDGLDSTQFLRSDTDDTMVGTLTMTGDILPSANVTYNLGSSTQRWNELWLSTTTVNIGDNALSADINNNMLWNNIQVVLSDVNTDIVPVTDNTYNLGSDTNQFATIYGHVVEATYADLAERYAADAPYEPGTVLVFGGEAEVTTTTKIADRAVAGIVSTDPAYLMNSKAGSSQTHPAIALKGRVPCKVVGVVKKGDLIVTSNIPGHAKAALENEIVLGSVIGKAIEDKSGVASGIVEVFVSMM